VSAKPAVLEFGMGVDVHGRDATKAACRAVSDAIRHSSLPLFQEVRERGGRMLVDVTVGVPDPDSVKVDVVRRELPHGEVTVRAVEGGSAWQALTRSSPVRPSQSVSSIRRAPMEVRAETLLRVAGEQSGEGRAEL